MIFFCSLHPKMDKYFKNTHKKSGEQSLGIFFLEKIMYTLRNRKIMYASEIQVPTVTLQSWAPLKYF